MSIYTVPTISLQHSTNPSRYRLDQSTNTVLRDSLSFLPKSLQQFLQSLRRWLTTTHASIQVIHKCSIFKEDIFLIFISTCSNPLMLKLSNISVLSRYENQIIYHQAQDSDQFLATTKLSKLKK